MPWVYHVDVIPYTNVQNNLAAIPGERVTNSTVMITTQLTGCSVMYETDAGRHHLVVAHIQPGGNPGGLGRGYNLAPNLRAFGGFSNGLHGPGVVRNVFGSSQGMGVNDYDPAAVPVRQTYIIGILHNGAWELHCQRHDIFNVNGVPVTWRVL